MRKVGYSAGLERTLDRFRQLEESYVAHRDVTAASWHALVEEWGLRTDNIADVFFALRIIQRTVGDVLVLENLDAVALAASQLESEGERQAARRMMLLWAILVNDGELFVNFLLAGFDEGRIRQSLEAMVEHKRRVLESVLPGRYITRRLARIVSVERQAGNRGSAGGGRTVASLIRTEPISEAVRRDAVGRGGTVVRGAQEGAKGGVISDDYFRKVPPRRKDWARTLGLWGDDEGLTNRGKGFVKLLRSRGYVGEEGFFIFWPMDYELIRAGFRPDLFREKRTLWGALSDFAKGYAGVEVKPFEPEDADGAVRELEGMAKVYRSLHTRKSVLRRELAVTVAYPACMAVACARRGMVRDLPRALELEQMGELRRVRFRRSRLMGGALTVGC